MVEVKPFRGIRYSSAVSGDLGINVCPPFDVINTDLQKELYERSPFNIVRLELARREMAKDPYYSAADTQNLWMKSGVLRRDREPSLYFTQETFDFDGQKFIRNGFICAVRLEEYDRNIIFPHENTRPEWVSDRVTLMGVAQSNYSPLLVLFRNNLNSTIDDITKNILENVPSIDISPPDLQRLKVWRVYDKETIEAVSNAFIESKLFIADGHHRYEAALSYRSLLNKHRSILDDESVNYRMMMLTCINQTGLITRGYHRTIDSPEPEELALIKQNINRYCKLEKWSPISDSADGIANELSAVLGNRSSDDVIFGIIGLEKDSYHIARLIEINNRSTILENSEYFKLHKMIIDPAFSNQRRNMSINFRHELKGVIESIQARKSVLGFVMRPIPLDEFFQIVMKGSRLPPKATNFFPKPSAGAVIQSLEGSL